MRHRLPRIAAVALSLAPFVAAHAQPITATIDAAAKAAPINPYLYGMFVEQAGNMLEQGMRAELLDDRKFFFAIGQSAPAGARPGRRGAAFTLSSNRCTRRAS